MGSAPVLRAVPTQFPRSGDLQCNPPEIPDVSTPGAFGLTQRSVSDSRHTALHEAQKESKAHLPTSPFPAWAGICSNAGPQGRV